MICLFAIISISGAAAAYTEDEPYFAEALNNITAPVGRDATFQCIVHNLGKGFQVRIASSSYL